MEQQPPPPLPVLLGMACSGLGPAIATVVSNPLEVCKTRLQFSGERGSSRLYRGPLDCLRETWRKEGMRGLQAGLGPAVVREGSKTFFRYGLFSPILEALHDGPPSSAPVRTRMAAGAAAGAIAATVCNPLDLLKCQLQATGSAGARSYGYSSAVGAVRYIVRTSPQGVRALWVGTGISIPRSMTSTSVMMTVNSWLKEELLSRGCWPQAATMLASLGAAACTIYAQAPLDIVRRPPPLPCPLSLLPAPTHQPPQTPRADAPTRGAGSEGHHKTLDARVALRARSGAGANFLTEGCGGARRCRAARVRCDRCRDAEGGGPALLLARRRHELRAPPHPALALPAMIVASGHRTVAPAEPPVVGCWQVRYAPHAVLSFWLIDVLKAAAATTQRQRPEAPR